MLNAYVQVSPPRSEAADELARELSQQQVNPILVPDLANGPKTTFVRLLQKAIDEKQWVIYLQDDAWPSPDFRARISAYLVRESFSILMLYCNRKETLEEAKDIVRISATALHAAVGLAIRVNIVRPFIDYYDVYLHENPQHFFANDLALGSFCKQNKLSVQACVPSLIQHRNGRSLLGHRGIRQSRSFHKAYGEVPPC